ncbi:MAG TPA: hypothetical protein VNC11_05995 [Gemmatimonadaceae bacterium]|jgi:hypothetical protein|nr:hypothetical protein [Gemmatimonadaceae bacterium]
MIARACIVVCVATLGCASAPTSGSAPATTHPASVTGDETVNIRLAEEPDAMNSVINAPPAKVWAAIPLVYKHLEITGAQVLDSDLEVYGNREFTLNRIDGTRTGDFVRCGEEGAGQALGSMVRRKLSIVTTVHGDANGKTTISTEISGYATPVEGTSTGAIRCASTGKLEKRIRSLVNQMVGT